MNRVPDDWKGGGNGTLDAGAEPCGEQGRSDLREFKPRNRSAGRADHHT